MDSVKSFFKASSTACLLFITCFFLLSCEESEVAPENDLGSQGSHTPVIVGDKVTNVDKDLFEQIGTLTEAINSNHIWNGFDLSKQNIYFVYLDSKDMPARGFFLNPHRNFDGAVEIFKSDSHELNIYAYDGLMGQAIDEINKTEGKFVANYDIEGIKYNLVKYNDIDVENHLTSNLLVKESFYAFQRKNGDNWYKLDEKIVDQRKFPLNNEQVALELLSLSVLKAMPSLTNPDEIKEILSMFVAIRSEEINQDPTKEMLVKNISNKLERQEGTTQYVANMSYSIAYDIPNKFIDIDPHQLETDFANDKNNVKDYLTLDIWHDTGASVTYCLKSLRNDVETELKNGKTPFELADEHLALSDQEKEDYLNKAKQQYGWEQSAKSAEKYINLFTK